MSIFSFCNIKTIVFLLLDFGIEYSTYIIYQDSIASIESICIVFHDSVLYFITKSMIEVYFICQFDYEFYRYKQELYNYV